LAKVVPHFIITMRNQLSKLSLILHKDSNLNRIAVEDNTLRDLGMSIKELELAPEDEEKFFDVISSIVELKFNPGAMTIQSVSIVTCKIGTIIEMCEDMKKKADGNAKLSFSDISASFKSITKDF